MTSDRKTGPHTPPRVRAAKKTVVAVEDEELREKLSELLHTSEVDFEVVDPGVDPENDPPEQVADLLILRRPNVRPADLLRLQSFTDEDSNPNLLVVADDVEDIDRTRMLTAGVSDVFEAQDPSSHLREAVEALAGSGVGGLRDPQSGQRDYEPRLGDFHSRSPRMREFLQLVQRVIETDSSLLITGETGVGKERLAQAIHNESGRSAHPFVSVNCGALPEALLESELFGHEAGAFTGAERRKRGRFEQASGGTIFLDEIGEMPLHLQVKLLSVLQRHRLQRVGGEELIEVDVRVMAATNRKLEDEIKARRFRSDLYYRLNVITLEIPPLRERREDIPNLVGSFLRHFRTSIGHSQVETISEDAFNALVSYDWPGNVRQLINAVEHAIVMCRERQITARDLPEWLHSAGTQDPEGLAQLAPATESGPSDRSEGLHALPLREARQQVVADFEKDYLTSALRRTQGKVGEAAELAGITPRSLFDKLKRYGIDKNDFR